MASCVPRPLPDFILQPWRTDFSRGRWDKSGSGLGTRLATHYAPYEVTKTLRHCLVSENVQKLRSVRVV